MTRLTLRIIQDQLTRAVVCLVSCAVLLSVHFISEQKFNMKMSLMLSFCVSLHASLSWGIYSARSGRSRLAFAAASLGLPAVRWWGPMLIVWLAGSVLLFSAERHLARQPTLETRAHIWPCEWRPALLPHGSQAGVCFAYVDEQGSAQLTGWAADDASAPITLTRSQLKRPQPSCDQGDAWGAPLKRWFSRALFITVILSVLLCAPLEYLGACSLLSYALSWLLERSALSVLLG